MFHRILKFALVSILALSVCSVVHAAWDAPSANPPDDNTYKPINQGETMQVKNGTFWLGGDNYTVNPGDWSFLVEKGRVGIGTTNPGAELDLVNTTSTQPIFTASDDTGAELLRIQNNGNVGISSSTPNYDLTVNGYGYFAQPVVVGTPTKDTHATTKSYVDSTLTTEVGSSTFWTLNGIDLYPASTTYDVGIGTSTPSYKLEVAGDINLTGTLYQNGSEMQTGYWEQSGSNIYYNTGNVGIGTTSPAYALDVAGYGQFSQPVTVGTPIADTHATTKSYVDSELAEATSTAENTYVNEAGDTMTGALDIQQPDTGDIFNISSSTAGDLMTITNEGDVGIGTTNPGRKLEITGGGTSFFTL